MHKTTTLTADAGQMYEAVHFTHAIVCIQKMMDCTNVKWVAVSRGKKRLVRTIPHKYAAKPGWHVFSVIDLVQAFVLAVTSIKARCGDQMVATDGVPTGGMLSKIATSIILGWAEHVVCTDIYKMRELGVDIAGIPFNELICCLRYVDDVLFISHMLCKS